MGRSNYNKRQNFVIQRGDDGNRRVYGDHDDRGSNSQQERGGQNRVWNRLGDKKVGFVDDGPRGGGIRKNRGGGRGGNNYKNNIAYGILAEHDEDMGDRRGEQAGRGRPLPGRWQRGGRRGRGGPSRIPIPGHLISRKGPADNLFAWSKVTLRNGSKYDKMALLRELTSKSRLPFTPICYTKNGINTLFYIEDQPAAKALKELDKQIELPDGATLTINVDRSTPPNMQITEEIVDKIKLVMSKRYNTESKALNLRTFHSDPDFAGESFYAPLWRSNIMLKVLEIIGENIPETTAIDLSDNKLLNLDHMHQLPTKAPNLNILHLAKNRLREARSLDKLKGLKLIELKLEDNPLVDNLGSSYISVVKKHVPTLLYLDGKQLPKEIGFDVGDDQEDTALPATIPKCIKNEAAGGIVLQFLLQFFKLYDSDSRQPLLDAYHENAVMSMACVGSFEQLKDYISESRNLLRVNREDRQYKLLRRGRLQVVSFLSSLPKTQHDPTTFTLDVPFTSEKLMTFTVSGMFKEPGRKNDRIKHFNRTFVVVPHNAGFVIVNEILFITFATHKDSAKAFTSAESSLEAVAAAAAAAASPSASATSPPALDQAAKQTIAINFSAKSGMNVEWSVKCLEENQWDFDKSAVVFGELKNSGKIPPEAFIK